MCSACAFLHYVDLDQVQFVGTKMNGEKWITFLLVQAIADVLRTCAELELFQRSLDAEIVYFVKKYLKRQCCKVFP